MTYTNKLMILSPISFFTYSIPLIVLHLSLVCLLCNAEILTACQSLCKRGKGDSVLEREKKGDVSALHFFNIGVGL